MIMGLFTFVFAILCIVFTIINKYISIVFLMALFNVLFLLFTVILNKEHYLTPIGIFELTVSIIALIYSILNIFYNINIISILFK